MNIKSRWEVDLQQFNQAMDSAKARVRRDSEQIKRESMGIGEGVSKGFGGIKSGLGALGIGVGIKETIDLVKDSLTRADDLADLGLKLRENTETIQRMDYVAQQTASVGVEQLANSFVKLEKNLGDVENTRAADALARYGITARELIAMPLDQKVLALADAFQKARSDGTGVTDLMDLLGRSGPELIPMLEQTRESLEALMEVAPVVDDASIQRLAQINDQWDGLIMKAKSYAVEAVAAMAAGADAIKDGFSGKSLQDQNIAAFQRELQNNQFKQRQAEAMENLGKAEARQKEADLREKAEKKVDAAREKLEDQRLARLSPEDRQAEFFRQILGGTGLEGLGKAGIERMIAGLDTGYNRERQAEWIGYLAEAEKIESEIARVQSEKVKELETLRDQTEQSGFRLLTPAQQAEALRRRLGTSLGVDVRSAQDVFDGLRELQAEAKAAAASGDQAREKAALEKLRKAQEDAAALGAIDLSQSGSTSGSGFQRNGEVARTFNLLFNRSADNPLLDESKRQTRQFETMNGTLREILDKIQTVEIFTDI